MAGAKAGLTQVPDIVARWGTRYEPGGARRSHLDEFLPAPQPALQMRLRGARRAAQQFVRRDARLFEQSEVLLQVGEAQQRHPGLARAHEFARTADEQVLAGDFEAVGV